MPMHVSGQFVFLDCLYVSSGVSTKSSLFATHQANFKIRMADIFSNMGKEGHFRKKLQLATQEALQTRDWAKFKAVCEQLTIEMKAMQAKLGERADFTDFMEHLQETLEYLQMQDACLKESMFRPLTASHFLILEVVKWTSFRQ